MLIVIKLKKTFITDFVSIICGFLAKIAILLLAPVHTQKKGDMRFPACNYSDIAEDKGESRFFSCCLFPTEKLYICMYHYYIDHFEFFVCMYKQKDPVIKQCKERDREGPVLHQNSEEAWLDKLTKGASNIKKCTKALKSIFLVSFNVYGNFIIIIIISK